jgi:hypothetical protein
VVIAAIEEMMRAYQFGNSVQPTNPGARRHCSVAVYTVFDPALDWAERKDLKFQSLTISYILKYL